MLRIVEYGILAVSLLTILGLIVTSNQGRRVSPENAVEDEAAGTVGAPGTVGASGMVGAAGTIGEGSTDPQKPPLDTTKRS